MPGRTQEEYLSEIASLKATTRAQAIEIRDLKRAMQDGAEKNASAIKELADALTALRLEVNPIVHSAEKLDRLLTEADRADGMKSLATMLIGGGFFASAGAALLGLFQYFSKGGG